MTRLLTISLLLSIGLACVPPSDSSPSAGPMYPSINCRWSPAAPPQGFEDQKCFFCDPKEVGDHAGIHCFTPSNLTFTCGYGENSERSCFANVNGGPRTTLDCKFIDNVVLCESL